MDATLTTGRASRAFGHRRAILSVVVPPAAQDLALRATTRLALIPYDWP